MIGKLGEKLYVNVDEFEDNDDDFAEETSQVVGEQEIEQKAGTLMLNR